MITRAQAEALDERDPLASFRAEFLIPDGIIYLNGNSLGPMPKAAALAARHATEVEWAQGLVRSWNAAGWFDLPYRMGDAIASLIGAEPGEVVVTNSTSVDLFKAAHAALALRGDRRIIVMEGSNFPTNNYTIQGLIQSLGQGHEIRFAEKEDLADAIQSDVAAVILTHVHYKTAHRLDMKALTARAHAMGALVVWDLCHSVGVLPVHMNDARVDFAVGCTYKYLNGGPGSPAFIFVAKRLQAMARQPLTGWWGHQAPFAFDRDYRPNAGIGRMLTGTQAIITMRAAEAGIDIARRADQTLVRAKSRAMGQMFLDLVAARCGAADFNLVSPPEADARGGHVAINSPVGYPIMKALIARGVIGDFRAPATMRFGFSPLFLRYVDVWTAVDILADILATRAWDDPAFRQVETVT